MWVLFGSALDLWEYGFFVNRIGFWVRLISLWRLFFFTIFSSSPSDLRDLRVCIYSPSISWKFQPGVYSLQNSTSDIEYSSSMYKFTPNVILALFSRRSCSIEITSREVMRRIIQRIISDYKRIYLLIAETVVMFTYG